MEKKVHLHNNLYYDIGLLRTVSHRLLKSLMDVHHIGICV